MPKRLTVHPEATEHPSKRSITPKGKESRLESIIQSISREAGYIEYLERVLLIRLALAGCDEDKDTNKIYELLGKKLEKALSEHESDLRTLKQAKKRSRDDEA